MRHILSNSGEQKLKLYKHMEARFLQHHVDNYYELNTFCIIRNPWDRMHSFYHYILQYLPALIETSKKNNKNPDHIQWHKKMYEEALNMSFSDWILNGQYTHHMEFEYNPHVLPAQIKSQFDFITDFEGNVMVDHIFKMETLDETLFSFLDTHNIPYNSIAYIKQTNRKNYREEYTQEARDHVTKYFERDIDYFKYIY